VTSSQTKEQNEFVPEKAVSNSNIFQIVFVLVLLISTRFVGVTVNNPFKPGVPADLRCVEYFSAVGPGENKTAIPFQFPESKFYWRFLRWKTNKEFADERMIRFDLYQGQANDHGMIRITGVRGQSAYEETEIKAFGKPSPNYPKDRETKWIDPSKTKMGFDLDEWGIMQEVES